jgi:hypothetical protein
VSVDAAGTTIENTVVMAKTPPLSFQLTLTPEDGNELDNAWQEECQQLIERLKSETNAPDALVEPETREIEAAEGEGHRGAGLLCFSSLLFSNIPDESLAQLLGILRDWLNRRDGSHVSLKLPDGTAIEGDAATVTDIMTRLRQDAE